MAGRLPFAVQEAVTARLTKSSREFDSFRVCQSRNQKTENVDLVQPWGLVVRDYPPRLQTLNCEPPALYPAGRLPFDVQDVVTAGLVIASDMDTPSPDVRDAVCSF